MKNPQKSPKKYVCIKCDYYTSNKKDFVKHENTLKHKMEINGNEKIPLLCPFCNKSYKTNSGLWKHKKICKKQNNEVEESCVIKPTFKKQELDHKDLIINKQQEQIGELKDMMMKLLEDNNSSKKLMKEMLPKIGNNTTNINPTNNIRQNISINVFLNEHCKNALNFRDFIDTINVSLEDVLKTKELGYSKGISDIFIKNLNELETTERPIHCSDQKELQFYVKDEDKWNHDNGEKIKTAITKCQKKQLEKIKEWEEQNQNWTNDEKKSEEYFKIVKEIMGQSSELEKEKNIKDIIKNVGDNTLLSSISENTNI